jgi:hypothetical protein
MIGKEKAASSLATNHHHYMEYLASTNDSDLRAKAASVQATKARKLRDKLFAQRMEELAAELCAQYVQSASAMANSDQKSPGRHHPQQLAAIPQEVIQAKIARLQQEIHAAVAEETERAASSSAARSARPSHRRLHAPQPPPPPASNAVLSSRGLRGVFQDAAAPMSTATAQQQMTSISARLRLDGGSHAGLGSSGSQQQQVLPSLSVPRLPLTTGRGSLLQDANTLLNSACDPIDDLPAPLSVATIDGRFRDQNLFPSLDVLLDGNTKVLSCRTPRQLNPVELGLRAPAPGPSAPFLGPPDYLSAIARADIQARIPEHGYLADLLEKKRRLDEAEREACARRAEVGWSPRDALMGDAAQRKKNVKKF